MATLNGIDVSALAKYAEKAKTDAKYIQDYGNRWNARVQWLDGTRTQIYAGKHTLQSDEPEYLLGKDTAAGPTELLLAAVGSCLTVTYVANAAAQGVKIDSLELQIDGEIDMPSFLGLKKNGSSGYKSVKIKAFVKSGAPREKLKDLLKLSVKRSPVTNTVFRGAKIIPELS
ncbi:MAG: OsmC family protein [Thaumarchaeota archaeon]|nr:OsmC family protein [Nitrososphaerota archaeon]